MMAMVLHYPVLIMTNWSCDKDCRIVGELIISHLKYFQCGKLSSDQSLNAPAFSPCSGPSAPSHRRLLIRRHARDAHLVVLRGRARSSSVTLCREGGKRETQHRPYSCHARRQPC